MKNVSKINYLAAFPIINNGCLTFFSGYHVTLYMINCVVVGITTTRTKSHMSIWSLQKSAISPNNFRIRIPGQLFERMTGIYDWKIIFTSID